MTADPVRYFVTTWDPLQQGFTPQVGVVEGPYTLFGLRTALRQLQGMGYDTTRRGGFSVWVEAAPAAPPKPPGPPA